MPRTKSKPLTRLDLFDAAYKRLEALPAVERFARAIVQSAFAKLKRKPCKKL